MEDNNTQKKGGPLASIIVIVLIVLGVYLIYNHNSPNTEDPNMNNNQPVEMNEEGDDIEPMTEPVSVNNEDMVEDTMVEEPLTKPMDPVDMAEPVDNMKPSAETQPVKPEVK